MKYIWVYIILGIMFSLSFVNAEGFYKSNTTIDLLVSCSIDGLNNCNASQYNLTIKDPEGLIIISNNPATKHPGYLSLTISFGNNTIIGRYDVFIVDNLGSTATDHYYSTTNGREIVGDNFLIFYYIIYFLLVISLIYIIIINVAKLATSSTTVSDVALSIGLYFAILLFYWIGNTYIPDKNFISLIGNIYMTTGVGFIFIILPLISLVITMIKKSVDKKNVPSIQELTGKRLFYG